MEPQAGAGAVHGVVQLAPDQFHRRASRYAVPVRVRGAPEARQALEGAEHRDRAVDGDRLTHGSVAAESRPALD